MGCVSGLECVNQTPRTFDCNVYVTGTSDTTSCDFTLYESTNDLNGRYALTEFKTKIFFYQFATPFNGLYYGNVECDGDTNDTIGVSFQVSDSNLESYVDTLEAGQVTITGNQATLQQNIIDVNLLAKDANRYGYDINRRIKTDLNVDLYTSSLTAASVWAYATRTLTDTNTGGIPANVWAYYDRKLTDYNQSTMFGYLQDINAHTTRIKIDLNEDAYLSAAIIWNNSTRTLTDYNMATLPGYIWIYSARTLTDYNLTQVIALVSDANKQSWDVNRKVFVDLNGDLYNASGLTAAQVWEYATRDLTDYNQSLQYSYFHDINTSVSKLKVDVNLDIYAPATAAIDVNAIANAVWTMPSKVLKFNFQDLMEIFYEVLVLAGWN